MLPFERRWRDELVAVIIPSPGPGLPALAALDRGPFWRRFDEVAPTHLRLGLYLAALVCAGILPRLFGHLSGLNGMEPARRDALLSRMAQMPLVGDLMELAKLTACLAYFDDAAIQRQIRGEGP